MTTQKKIAVVTGSNRGLGYAISRQLSQIGNRVILTSRNETDGLAAKQQLTNQGFDVDYNCCLFSNTSRWRSARTVFCRDAKVWWPHSITMVG